MNYKSRPVFDLPVNFYQLESSIKTDFSISSRGLGNETPWNVEDFAQRTFNVSLLCSSKAQIQAVEDFFDAVKGQLQGFWLPTYKADFSLQRDILISDSTILIDTIGFVSKFEDHPGNKFFCIIEKDNTINPFEILSVSEGVDFEAITLPTTIGKAFNKFDNPLFSALVYVRFDGDSLEWEYTTGSVARASFKARELTQEYTAQELGISPVYLYRITQGLNVEYWTAYPQTVTAGGIDWNKKDISHSSINRTLEFIDDGVKLNILTRDSSNLFRAYLAGIPTARTVVEIYQIFFPALTLDMAAPIYSGDVQRVNFEKHGGIEIELSSVLRIGEWTIPRVLIQRTCNWRLFEANTCMVNKPSYETTTTIDTVTSGYIEAAALSSHADNYFSIGMVKTANESRLITGHVGNRIYIQRPFLAAVIGQEIKVYPGCDKTTGTCASKFSNLTNFGGFPNIPPLNPALNELQPPKQKTGKK